MKVLLVTGARVLDDNDASREWAQAILRDAVAQHDALVHGGARGPDKWAARIASDRARLCVEFPLERPGIPHLRVFLAPGLGVRRPAKDADRYAYDPRNPLSRNDAMVLWCTGAAAAGHEVTVLALRSKRARTHGTAYTARKAREAGLAVTEMWEPEVTL